MYVQLNIDLCLRVFRTELDNELSVKFPPENNAGYFINVMLDVKYNDSLFFKPEP